MGWQFNLETSVQVNVRFNANDKGVKKCTEYVKLRPVWQRVYFGTLPVANETNDNPREGAKTKQGEKWSMGVTNTT
jgi:hypothetical protein